MKPYEIFLLHILAYMQLYYFRYFPYFPILYYKGKTINIDGGIVRR